MANAIGAVLNRNWLKERLISGDEPMITFVGSPTIVAIPPTFAAKTIIDHSPLLRDENTVKIRPITPARIHDIVHDQYLRSGLIRECSWTLYVLKAHSQRKYYQTEL